MNKKNYKKNTKEYKILTLDGYKDFSGVAYMGDKQIIKILFTDGSWIRCSERHRFFNTDKIEIFANDIHIGDELFGLTDDKIVQSIEKDGVEATYDLIDVDGHVYYTNGILSHNCQFISFEETLINPLVLKDLRGQEPFETVGRTRWYSPLLPNRIYLIGLDPSMGTGGDNAAITVWMLPEYIQVGEWIHNKTDVKGQVRVLMDMLAKIHRDLKAHPDQEGRPEIYWSVENNSLGEAALVVIDNTGEELFAGDFTHEPGKKRKGFTTTNKTKIEACARLKSLIESGKMEIRSTPLATELKSFIKSNRSYRAQSGDLDDIIMSTLLCIRILDEIQKYEKDVYDRLAEIIELDGDNDGPMPFLFA